MWPRTSSWPSSRARRYGTLLRVPPAYSGGETWGVRPGALTGISENVFRPEWQRPGESRASLGPRHMTLGRGGIRVMRPSYAPRTEQRSAQVLSPRNLSTRVPRPMERRREPRSSHGDCPRKVAAALLPPRVRVAFEDRRTPCLGGDPVEEGGGHGCRGLLVRPGASLVQWCPGRSFPGANPMSLTYSICLTCLMYPTRSTERAGRTRSAARESPGAQERRGPSSPVLTRSPELPGSIPSDRLPRAARLPLKISPRQRRSILEGGHSNEGCCTSEACFRM